MWKDSIAEIFVPHAGSDGKTGEVATGYPVAPNRILTAYHAVFPKSAHRDESRPIEIRWHNPRVEPDWQPVQGIAWKSEMWDLVLLECALPSEISVLEIILSDQKPIAHTTYEAVGFPRIGGKRNEVRNAFHIQGSVYSMLEADDRFDLEEPAGPLSEEDWKGASGSPVVANRRILGVIAEVPGGLMAKRLRAVPLWKVLRDEADFYEKVSYRKLQERQDRLDQARQQIQQLLEPATECTSALIEKLPNRDESKLALSTPKEKVSLLVSGLLALTDGQMLEVCHQAHKNVGGGCKAEPICAAVQIILPVVYDQFVIENVRASSENFQARVLALPVSHHTIAEIIMAGVDDRETRYYERKNADDLPKGKLCLPPPPECGIDTDGTAMVGEINKHMSKFSLNSSHSLENAVDGFIVWKFTRSDSAKYTPEQRREIAADEIEFQAKSKNLTYYILFERPKETEDSDALEKVLIKISEKYPRLVCLILNQDYSIHREDLNKLRFLRDLLPIRHPDSTTTDSTGTSAMQSPTNPTFNINANNVALSTGNGSPAQAGSNQTANINQPKGVELSEFVRLLGELGLAINQVNSTKARETLQGHIVQAQTESEKPSPDKNLLQRTLETIKSGADMLEDGGKIIGICSKALEYLSNSGILF